MTSPTAADPPTWMHTVGPGTFDRRVLDQTTYWITKEARIRPLHAMSSEHLRNVVLMLTEMAPVLHLAALGDLLLQEDSGAALVVELTLYELTGTCLATVVPGTWLQATPLVRAIHQELSQRGE